MGKPTKRATVTRQRAAKPPRIKGPIQITDEAVEIWEKPNVVE